MSASKTPGRIAIVAATLLVGALIGEAAMRLSGGYRLSSFRLTQRLDAATPLNLPPAVWSTAQANEIGGRYLDTIPRPDDVKREWFFTDPPNPPARPPRPDLEALSAPYADQTIGKFARRIWNINFVLDQARRRQSYWETLKQIRTPLHVFDPADHSPYPRFRMSPDDPHGDGWPTGTFTTNNLGYRGADVVATKPSNTFRIVFVGASTTMDHYSFPLSFADYVGHYLNLWAKARGVDVTFETVNAAREGLQSEDIAAVVEQEIRPLSPDVVVYKEGANQFSAAKRLLTISGASRSPIDQEFLRTGVVDDWPGLRFSAVERRMRSVAARYVALGEIQKPAYVVNWPASVDEQLPDVTSADLPLDLPVILSDLDRIKILLRPGNAAFAVSTFVWLVDDNLKVKASRIAERELYWYLNGNEVLWPLRYHDIKRFATFQNVVFQRYCAVNDLQLVDLARWFPKDPELFIDAIHTSYAGIKVHGWITFLQLLPLVERRLTRQQHTAPVEPAQTPGVSLTSIAQIETKLAEGAEPLRLPRLADWQEGSPAVHLTRDGDRLRVEGTSNRWAYQLKSVPISVEPDHYYRVKLDARITSGAIGVGVLDERGSWIASPLDMSAFTFNSGSNKAVQLVVADATPDLRAVTQSVFEIGATR
jgi:hypothetical protein